MDARPGQGGSDSAQDEPDDHLSLWNRDDGDEEKDAVEVALYAVAAAWLRAGPADADAATAVYLDHLPGGRPAASLGPSVHVAGALPLYALDNISQQ